MTHEHHDGDCHAIHVLPSGELRLVCKHTNEPLAHGPSLRIIKLDYTAQHKQGVAEVQVLHKMVPVICESGVSFSLNGGFVCASPCDCVHDKGLDE